MVHLFSLPYVTWWYEWTTIYLFIFMWMDISKFSLLWVMLNNTGFLVSVCKSFSRCPCISKEESLGYKICTHSIEIAKWQTSVKWLYLFTFPPAVDEIFLPTLCIIDFETFASQKGVKLYVIGVLGTFLWLIVRFDIFWYVYVPFVFSSPLNACLLYRVSVCVLLFLLNWSVYILDTNPFLAICVTIKFF